MTAADRSHIRDGEVGDATRAGRDSRRTVAGQAGDAVNTRGLNGFPQWLSSVGLREAVCQHHCESPILVPGMTMTTRRANDRAVA